MTARDYILAHGNHVDPAQPPRYPRGTRVRLRDLVIDGEAFPAEDGEVLSASFGAGTYTYVVEVDPRFRESPDDDGLRELEEHLIERRLED